MTTQNVFDRLQAIAESGAPTGAFKAADFQELGRAAAAGNIVSEKIGTAYLRAIVAGAQADVVTATDMARINCVHTHCLPHILIGVTTPDVAPEGATDAADRRARSLERNRRSNFARTAASAVRAFLSAGGKLADVNAALVTKSLLVQATNRLRASVPSEDVCPVDYAALPELFRSVAIAERRLYRALMRAKAIDAQAVNVRAAGIAGELTANF